MDSLRSSSKKIKSFRKYLNEFKDDGKINYYKGSKAK